MKRKYLWGGLVGITATVLMIVLVLVFVSQPAQPQEAPEAESILKAQSSLPFQILIPAYLPAGFERSAVQIDLEASGPQGQPLVRLMYSHPIGVILTLYEWLPSDPAAPVAASPADSVQECHCMCAQGLCSASGSALMIDNGALRIKAETSDPALLSTLHINTILTTLGPASGLETYTDLDQAVKNFELPPAEEAKINTSNEQEVFLVVTSTSYEPVHFSVKKGMPVRLTFRQLGNVGCGNELYLPWSDKDTAHLVLSGPQDTQIITFTPEQTGDFLFHCPHYYYRGIMTVIE